jgi:hypothetical protein
MFPAIEQGLAKSGRSRENVNISVTAFVITSPEESEFVRQQIAFYASTPSYRSVMALHGWEAVAEQLSALAARGKWGEMPGLIDNEMLGTFATVVDASELTAALSERYGGVADRLALYLPFIPGERDAFWKKFLA